MTHWSSTPSATSCRRFVFPARFTAVGTLAASPATSGPPATTHSNPNRSRSGPTNPANRSTGHYFVTQFAPGISTANLSGVSPFTYARSPSSTAK